MTNDKARMTLPEMSNVQARMTNQVKKAPMTKVGRAVLSFGHLGIDWSLGFRH
jgi:hypothetical protein